MAEYQFTITRETRDVLLSESSSSTATNCSSSASSLSINRVDDKLSVVVGTEENAAEADASTFSAAASSLNHHQPQEEGPRPNDFILHEEVYDHFIPAPPVSSSAAIPMNDLVAQFAGQASFSLNNTPRRRLSLDTTGDTDSLGTHGTPPPVLKYSSSAEDINSQLNSSVASSVSSFAGVVGIGIHQHHPRISSPPDFVGTPSPLATNVPRSNPSSTRTSPLSTSPMPSPPVDFSSLHQSQSDKLTESEPIVPPLGTEEKVETGAVVDEAEIDEEEDAYVKEQDADDEVYEFGDDEENEYVDVVGEVDEDDQGNNRNDHHLEEEKSASATIINNIHHLPSSPRPPIIVDDDDKNPVIMSSSFRDDSKNTNNNHQRTTTTMIPTLLPVGHASSQSSEDDDGTIVGSSSSSLSCNHLNVPSPLTASISPAGSVFMSTGEESSRDSGYSETSNPPILNLAAVAGEQQKGFENFRGPVDFAQPIGLPLRSSQSQQKSQLLPPASAPPTLRVRFMLSSSTEDDGSIPTSDNNGKVDDLQRGIVGDEENDDDDDDGWSEMDADENDDINQEFMGSLTLGDLARDGGGKGDGLPSKVQMSYSPNCLNVVDDIDHEVGQHGERVAAEENHMYLSVNRHEAHRPKNDQLDRTPNSRNVSMKSLRRQRPLTPDQRPVAVRKSGLTLLKCGAPNIGDLQPSPQSTSGVGSSSFVVATSNHPNLSQSSHPHHDHGVPLVRTPLSTVYHSNSLPNESSATDHYYPSNTLPVGSKRCYKWSPNEGVIINVVDDNDNKENEIMKTSSIRRSCEMQFEEVSKTLLQPTTAPICKRRKSLASPNVLALLSGANRKQVVVENEAELLIRKKAQNRFLNVRCQSESMLRFSQSGLNFDDRNLVADYSKGHLLPLINNPINSGVSSISCHTVAKLLQSELQIPKSIRFQFIDCRYPYEYHGGHINDAIHFFVNRPEMLKSQWFSPPPPAGSQQETIYIFYCEFSRERGPKMYRAVRAMDRKINAENYPKCSYPEIYLLEGGYKNFYANYPELCSGGYKPMVDDMVACRQFKAKSKSCSTLPGDTVARRPGLQRSLLSSMRTSSTAGCSVSSTKLTSVTKSLSVRSSCESKTMKNNNETNALNPPYSSLSQPSSSISSTTSSDSGIVSKVAEFTIGDMVAELCDQHHAGGDGVLQSVTLIPDDHFGSPSL